MGIRGCRRGRPRELTREGAAPRAVGRCLPDNEIKRDLGVEYRKGLFLLRVKYQGSYVGSHVGPHPWEFER